MKSLQKNLHSSPIEIEVCKNFLPVQPRNALFVTILRSLLLDVDRLRPGTKGLDRDLVTLEARIEHEGPAFLGTALCNLGHALDRGISTGTFVCPVGFKTRPGSKLPRLFGGIFNDVFDDATGTIKDRDCTEDVKILRQLLFFLEKACDGFGPISNARVEDDRKLLFGRSFDREPSSFSEGSYQPDLPFGSSES